MKTIPIQSEPRNRTCGECTKCCEGYLKGSAYGHNFYRGRKCFFLEGKECSIYHIRPDDPCKIYNCAWITDHTIPNWMKPNLVDVIITNRHSNGINYVELTEAGSKLNIEVFSWFVQEYAKGTYDIILYMINNEYNIISKTNEWEKIDF